MKFLGGYAILAATVFGEGDPEGTRTVTFGGDALSSLPTTINKYATTQTTEVTVPILPSSWTDVATESVGSYGYILIAKMEAAITTQCVAFTSDFPQYTFTLAASTITYTNTFTSPNVIIKFSVGVDVVYETKSLFRKRRALATDSDEILADVRLRITELVDTAATAFATGFDDPTWPFFGITDGSATISTEVFNSILENEIDACEKTPCLASRAICTDNRGGDSTSSGRVCELDACIDNPCSTDSEINKWFRCDDIAGEVNTAAGRTCVDEYCPTDPCNGRGCLDAQCTCDIFTQSATEIIDPNSPTCETVTCGSGCLNGGMCTNVNGSPECDCASATYDNTMEIRDTTATDCAAKPCPGTCLNGGLCEEDDNSEAACVCKVESGFSASFFTGSLCESFDLQTVVDEIIALTAEDASLTNQVEGQEKKLAEETKTRKAADLVLDTKIDKKFKIADTAIKSARTDLTEKIDVDLKGQARDIASETDEKIKNAKTGLEMQITSNNDKTRVLSKGLNTLNTEIQANRDSIEKETDERIEKTEELKKRIEEYTSKLLEVKNTVESEEVKRAVEDKKLETRIDTADKKISSNKEQFDKSKNLLMYSSRNNF